MFVNPEEIIFHNTLALCYRVEIDNLEFADWHDPSDSSSDDVDVRPP
jgi:hypothetical protein